MSSIEDPKSLSLRTGQASGNVLGINAPPSPAHKSAPADSSVHYTCFIRLPFPRGDFVDPPQIVRYGRSSLKPPIAKSWTVRTNYDAYSDHHADNRQGKICWYLITLQPSALSDWNTGPHDTRSLLLSYFSKQHGYMNVTSHR
ncbi:hypothetical protein E4T42_02654 [Aureobasidium subglaciale]|nr:hypothetical protein E4T38_00977 [Aureobasidium subglaciale]KAI5230679.1 hypothetical protein E4T40_00978 [Aureobasidium subglaciale]KAI5233858.1 hypothetical protein E4T41_00976 [Aureobasidium subglaciale]KAI5254013.1 hypothetical protein E4T42_02654 [Aureobasidium subglaciale]KAI5267389.1 hypothetical protein E4T46_00976 [Aureobasidium subglaciale]